MICGGCGFSAPIPWMICPACRSRDRIEEEPVFTGSSEDLPPAVMLANVAARPPAAVRTGTVLDALLRDRLGIPLGITILLHGSPGVGKSRVALCAAEGWVRNGGTARYVLLESLALWDLRRMAEEHGLTGNGIEVTMKGGLEPLTAGKPWLVVIDASSELALIQTAVAFVHDAHAATVLLLAHETKDGDYRGSADVGHEVDVQAALRFLRVKRKRLRTSEPPRVLEIEKNRCGPVGAILCPWPITLPSA